MSSGDRAFKAKHKQRQIREVRLKNGDTVREFNTYCLLNNTDTMAKDYLLIRVQLDAEAVDNPATLEQKLEAAERQNKALKRQVYDLHLEVRQLLKELDTLRNKT